MTLATKTLQLIGVLVLAFPAIEGRSDESGAVDSILDRLENFEDESIGLQHTQEPFVDIDPKPEQVTKSRSKSEIQASLPEVDNISDISKAIAKLEGEVDKLTADIQKTRQKVLEDANLDSFIEIGALLRDGKAAAIRSFTAKIDGYEIFSLEESSGFWLPNQRLPIFAGPLQTGSHRIDIECRLNMKITEAIPLNGDVHRFINKTFDLNVTGPSFRKRLVLDVKPPETQDAQPALELTTSDL
jgi:hypothetical protein